MHLGCNSFHQFALFKPIADRKQISTSGQTWPKLQIPAQNHTHPQLGILRLIFVVAARESQLRLDRAKISN